LIIKIKYFKEKTKMETYKVTVDNEGTICWYQNGLRHRLDGPAIEWADGDKSWYIEDEKYTEAEFSQKMNPVKELSVKQISDLLGYEVKIIK
jgi:hypothetical protein